MEHYWSSCSTFCGPPFHLFDLLGISAGPLLQLIADLFPVLCRLVLPWECNITRVSISLCNVRIPYQPWEELGVILFSKRYYTKPVDSKLARKNRFLYSLLDHKYSFNAIGSCLITSKVLKSRKQFKTLTTESPPGLLQTQATITIDLQSRFPL